jgi:RNase H-like domain found in reverse transcriptase
MALDTLIKKIEADPQLSHPDPDKPLEVEIDALDYATGVVLIQQDEQTKRIEVGYHSEALNHISTFATA